jgi:hypothetical protein
MSLTNRFFFILRFSPILNLQGFKELFVYIIHIQWLTNMKEIEIIFYSC